MTHRKKCRIWWPDKLARVEPSSDLLLFGWYMTCGSSVDAVVATAVPMLKISACFPRCEDLKEMLHFANGKMPLQLQETSAFAILGQCVADPYADSELVDQNKNLLSGSKFKQQQCIGPAQNFSLKDKNLDSMDGQCHEKSCAGAASDYNHRRWKCGCKALEGLIEHHTNSSIRSGNWIQLLYRSKRMLGEESKVIPELHHIHLNGDTIAACDAHVVIYDQPSYGRNHLSLSSWGFSLQVRSPSKKPNWINDLQKKPFLDLDSVILALNCSNAASVLLDHRIGIVNPVIHFFCKPILVVFIEMVWHFVAVIVASISSITYLFLQFFYNYLSRRSQTFFFVLEKMFQNTWKNVHIRSCQILYWPIFLQDTSFSSQSNIEYAHKAALQKHFNWSSVGVDVMLGIVFGVLLLINADAIWLKILAVVHYMTDNALRSGCVWLMGVPAGFKLNTELAELLGMISLNAVQIFSTLWSFMSTSLRYIIEGLALSGIVFGLTVPAALCIDLLKLATLHVTTLHWLISFLYSQQLQALASLWRLFRGRKWNPLRERLDSYDYTVEQHVVGSLFFTPFLLLLPTTSVFYIFFTILRTMITFVCILIEIMISVLHAVPYAEILLWFTRRSRFPSGIWFESISVPSMYSHADYGQSDEGSETLLSLLHSNYATIGQVIGPHYSKTFHGVASSFGKSLAYGFLSGQRIPSTLHTNLPPSLPWIRIGFREYWTLCRSSMLSGRL
ncbi:uncharacterized protein [Typha angustifolia]|uniref:uncharacterized protein isoform X1 n=1 Tax=Typha angustifolia TaxID=59011 RepID=UPI003C2AFB5A